MKRSEAGMTLLEIMIAIAIMMMMMMMAWRMISNTSTTRVGVEKYEERNHELRMAMARVVSDFESCYLSRNEDINNSHPRTLLVAKPGNKVPDVKFSTMSHRVLWADANESDQTVIQYLVRSNPEHPGQYDWVRREQRRPSNQPPEEEPADYDILATDIENVKFEFWNWKNLDWQDNWDTTQSDGQRGWLPTRVRITLTVKGQDHDVKLVSQARIIMQETLNFSPT
jgi:general secretion pathway protein J